MKNNIAINKLESVVNTAIGENPNIINLRLHQSGSYVLKHRKNEEPERQVEGTLRGTVMPSAVLIGLSERSHPGYKCNHPVPVRGMQGACYEMNYLKG